MPAVSARRASFYGEPVIGPGQSLARIAAALRGIVTDSSFRGLRRAILAALGSLGCTAAMIVAAFALVTCVGEPARALAVLALSLRDMWFAVASGALLVSGVLILAGAEWHCAIARITETVAFLAALSGLIVGLAHPDVWSGGASAFALVLVSAGLWLTGLRPDMAWLRADSPAPASGIVRSIAGGWTGSAPQWRGWSDAYRALGLLGALVAVAVQTEAGLSLLRAVPEIDDLTPVIIFIGAVSAGIGIAAASAVGLRQVYRLDALITGRHLDILARILLVLGLVGFYCHATTLFMAQLFGEEASLGLSLVLAACGVLPVQLFWLPRFRRSGLAIALVGLLVALSAFLDRVALPASVALPQTAIAPEWAVAASLLIFPVLLVAVLRSVPAVSITLTGRLVADRDPGSAEPCIARAEPASAYGDAIVAECASRDAFASVARTLACGDRMLRLRAYGPLPMTDLDDVLHPPRAPLRRYAFVGALVGGIGCLAVRLAGAAPMPAAAVLDGSALWWAGQILPSVTMALATAALAVLFAWLRRGETHDSEIARDLARRAPRRYILVASPPEAEADPTQIMRRLSTMLAMARRPFETSRIPS